MLVTKIDLKVGNTKFIFEKIDDYKEIYSRLVYDNVYERCIKILHLSIWFIHKYFNYKSL